MLYPALNLIKFTHEKLFVSGNYFEFYYYQKPLFYNFPPNRRTTRSARAENSLLKNRRKDNLWRTQQKLRRLINANLGKELPKFLTLTFKENITDLKIANKYFSDFILRLKRFLKYKPQYLCVVEFQKRGAIHYHCLIFNMPYTENIKGIFNQLWQYGFTQLKAIKEIQNIGAYVSKYLTKKNIDKRLCGNKAYFGSRSLKKPQEYKNALTIAEILKNVKLEEKVVREYFTEKYGIIKYKQYKKT